jgi:lipopolysaccharide export system permease protein
LATTHRHETGGSVKTIKKLIYSEVLWAVIFVTLSFMALFFFFDFVDELKKLGRNNGAYQIQHAAAYVMLLMPNHLYELLPICVLIGTIFVMARLAQSSEFTILRTSGLGPGTALKTLLGIGSVFVVVTFLIGDYLSPYCDKEAQLLKSRFAGDVTVGQTGAWLKENVDGKNFAININALTPEGNLRGIRIFEFDGNGQWRSLVTADSAKSPENGEWQLFDVTFEAANADKSKDAIVREHAKQRVWPTSITAEMVSVAILKPDRMGTVDLLQYIIHLRKNAQLTQKFEIAFWKKLFYPLSCLVMVVLALPFAYLHFRSGNITGHVFGGVLAGLSFFLLNNAFSFVGNINNWAPWFAAAAPGLLYSIASLAAFGWLVLRQ